MWPLTAVSGNKGVTAKIMKIKYNKVDVKIQS